MNGWQGRARSAARCGTRACGRVPDSWRAPRPVRRRVGATSRFRSGTSNRNTFASRLFARGVSRVVDGPGPGPRRRRRVARRLQHRLVSLYVQGKSRYDTRAGSSFVFQDTKLSCVFALRVDRMRFHPFRSLRANRRRKGSVRLIAAPRREARTRRRPARARGSRRAHRRACTRRRRPRSRRRPRGAPRGGGGHRVLHLAVWVRRVGGAEAQVPHFAPQHDDERAREEQQDLHAQQEPGRAVVVRVGEDAILYREDEGGGGGAREGQRGDGRGCPRENPRRRRGAPELNASSEALPRWCLGRFAHVPLPDRFASPTG